MYDPDPEPDQPEPMSYEVFLQQWLLNARGAIMEYQFSVKIQASLADEAWSEIQRLARKNGITENEVDNSV
jgi:hypothetical protein